MTNPRTVLVLLASAALACGIVTDAEAQAKRAGLNRVYVYNDKGCDCATENKPIEVYLEGTAEEIHQVKQCAASCCGSEGILLKKYEQAEKKQ